MNQPTTIEELKMKRSYRTAWLLVCALSNHCAADPIKTVDLLTGYLWDEEEAGDVKRASCHPLPEGITALTDLAESHGWRLEDGPLVPWLSARLSQRNP